VENKSIEIVIKNPQFTPIHVTEYTPASHYWYENYVPTPVECNHTADLYYNLRVKGHFGDDWTPVGSSSSPPQSNAQLDSKYTVIPIKAEYPDEAVLDFQVQALIGFYLPYGRTAVIFGYDFYGQESDWSNIQTLTMDNAQVSTSTPTATVSPPELTPVPTATTTPTTTPIQPNTQSNTELSLTWEQMGLVISVVVVAVLAVAVLALWQRKPKTA
jgi:hypothetical protein